MAETFSIPPDTFGMTKRRGLCASYCGATCCCESENEGYVTFRPDYLRLLEAEVSDVAVCCLDAAMFLFAIEQVKSC
jgi:hypothetical protein